VLPSGVGNITSVLSVIPLRSAPVSSPSASVTTSKKFVAPPHMLGLVTTSAPTAQRSVTLRKQAYRFGNSIVYEILRGRCPGINGVKFRPHMTWHPLKRFWGSAQRYADYWKSPCVQKAAAKLLQPYVYQGRPRGREPVLHWRCSDAPFRSDPMYEVPSVHVVDQLRSLLRTRGYSRLLVVTSESHKLNARVPKGACRRLLTVYMNALGLPYTYHSTGTPEGDFQILYNAPLVIAIVNSSYSMSSKLTDLDNYRVVYSHYDLENGEVNAIPWRINVPTFAHKHLGYFSDFSKALSVVRAR